MFAVGEGPVPGQAVVHPVVGFKRRAGQVRRVRDFNGDRYVERVTPALQRSVDGHPVAVQFDEVQLEHFVRQFVPGVKYVVDAGYLE